MYNYDKKKQIYYIVTVSIVLVLFSFIHISMAIHKGEYTNACANFFVESYITIEADWIKHITALRGENTANGDAKSYITDPEIIKKLNKNLKHSLTMSWHLIHIFNNFLFGLFVPHYYVQAVLFGIAFEVFEYFHSKCHDWMDIIYNGIGLVIGILCNFLIYNTFMESLFGISSVALSVIFAIIVASLFHLFIFNKMLSYKPSKGNAANSPKDSPKDTPSNASTVASMTDIV